MTAAARVISDERPISLPMLDVPLAAAVRRHLGSNSRR
jgi:hypothetical protein